MMKHFLRKAAVFCAAAVILGTGAGFTDDLIPAFSDSQAIVASAEDTIVWYTDSYGEYRFDVSYTSSYTNGTLELVKFTPKNNSAIDLKLPDKITVEISDRSGKHKVTNCRLETIGATACYRLNQITTLVIPSSVKKIGAHAFEDCTNMSCLSFSNNSVLEEIGASAFANCTSLKKIINCPKTKFEYEGKRRTDGTPVVSRQDLTFKNNVVEEVIGDFDVIGHFSCEFPNLKKINNMNIVVNGEINRSVEKGIAGCDYGDIPSIDAPMQKLIQNKVNEIISSKNCKTELEKITAIHDWICGEVSYSWVNGEPDESRTAHSDYSVFLNDKVVCDGYSRGFALLAYYAGLECYPIHGGEHAWNIVKLGQQFYHIDVCGDDGEPIKYVRFLRSDESIKSLNSPWELYPTAFPGFKGRDLPRCWAELGDVDGDNDIDNDDFTALKKLAIGDGRSNHNKVAADLNFDGSVTSADIVAMMQFLCAQKSNRSLTMTQFLAGRY